MPGLSCRYGQCRDVTSTVTSAVTRPWIPGRATPERRRRDPRAAMTVADHGLTRSRQPVGPGRAGSRSPGASAPPKPPAAAGDRGSVRSTRQASRPAEPTGPGLGSITRNARALTGEPCSTYVHVCTYAHLCTHDVCTYGVCTHGECTYDVCTYGVCTHGVCTYAVGQPTNLRIA
jgi:hypothetical protein